jgi:hypothetical protein
MLGVELAWDFKVLVDMVNFFGVVNIAYCPLMIELVKVFVLLMPVISGFTRSVILLIE